jgi:hypothetical protein
MIDLLSVLESHLVEEMQVEVVDISDSGEEKLETSRED